MLTTEDYDTIAASRIITEKYLLLYARRYNKEMEAFAEKIARDNGWTIVEISLRSTNSAKGHKMFYEAGVEEFLSLVKYSEYVITNSFHGLIFAVQYRKQLAVFSRESGDNKIAEVLELFDLKRMPSPKSTFSNSTNPRLRCCACTYKYCKRNFSGLSHERT